MVPRKLKRTNLTDKESLSGRYPVYMFVAAHDARPGGSPFIEFIHGLAFQNRLIGQESDEFHDGVVVLDGAVYAAVHKLISGIRQGVLFFPVPDAELPDAGVVRKDPLCDRMEIRPGPAVDFREQLLYPAVEPPPAIRALLLCVSFGQQTVNKFVRRIIDRSQRVNVVFDKLACRCDARKRGYAARIEENDFSCRDCLWFLDAAGKAGIPFMPLFADYDCLRAAGYSGIENYLNPVRGPGAVGQAQDIAAIAFGNRKAVPSLGVLLREETSEGLEPGRPDVSVAVPSFCEEHPVCGVYAENDVLQYLGRGHFVFRELLLYIGQFFLLAIDVHFAPALRVAALLYRCIPEVFAKIRNAPELLLRIIGCVDPDLLSQYHGRPFAFRYT